MKYDRAEAVRYMGAKKDDNEAAVLADLAYLQLRNEVRPRSCWQIFACRVDDAGVTLVDNGMRFESKNLAGHLQGCQKAAVLAATLGSNADTVLRRLALTNVAQAAAAQAVCAALIESYCDETEAEIAAAAGLHLKPRFSPGVWRLAAGGSASAAYAAGLCKTNRSDFDRWLYADSYKISDGCDRID